MTAKHKHVPFSLPIKNGTAIVHGDPGMSDESRAALTRIAESACEALARGDFDRPSHRRMGRVERELRSKQHMGVSQLYFPRGPNRLSHDARRVLADAHHAITGMFCSVNDYWLPQVMSEAIEACEALAL